MQVLGGGTTYRQSRGTTDCSKFCGNMELECDFWEEMRRIDPIVDNSCRGRMGNGEWGNGNGNGNEEWEWGTFAGRDGHVRRCAGSRAQFGSSVM